MPSGPDWTRYVRTHLRLPAMQGHREDRIVAELADHLEDVYRDALSRGMSAEAAKDQAEQRLGDAEVAARELTRSEPSHLRAALHRRVEQTDARLRDQGGRWVGLADLLRDVRYGVRMLRKRPGFTLVAVLSLAIGIGANTAIFSLVNALILRDLPYEHPEELVDLHIQLPDRLLPVLSYPDLEDLRDGTTEVFTGILASYLTSANVARGDGEANVFGEVVTGSYFSVLGIDAMLGRTLGPDDDRTPGAHPVVMLSHSYWQSGFGGDPDVVGGELRVEGRVYTIVGVGPASYPGLFRGVVRPAFYEPMMMLGELGGGNQLNERDRQNMYGKARLAPGVTLAQVETAVAAVSAMLTETRPEGWDPAGGLSFVPTTDVVLISPDVDGGIRAIAWLLMVVVGLVLLLACVNLAGFLLARALDRRREVAVRLALGASRGALIRQLLTETTLLSLLGGGVGLGLAVWLLRVVPRLDVGLGVTPALDLSLDWNVLAFTLGISVLAGALLGLVPALQATRPDVAATLKRETAGGGQPGGLRWRNALVVIQLTVSLVLLVGAGLFLRSLQAAADVDPGFGQTPTAIMRVAVPGTRFAVDEGRQYTRRLLDRFRALPGVDAVGMISVLPLTPGRQEIYFTVDGHEPPQDQEAFHGDWTIVDAGFFDAAGISSTQGRRFADTDRQGGQPVVIVSAAMARRFWPDGEAVGQLVRLVGGSPALPGGSADLRVVGVARDIDWESLSEPPRLLVYVPYSQYYSSSVTVVARTSADAEQTALALLTAGKEVDAELSAGEPTTIAHHLSALLRPAQAVTVLLAVFATLALLLAVIGLYGVVSYGIATRTREVGIRVALGADAAAVGWLLTTTGACLVAIGSGIGLAVSLLVTRLLASLLFGIEPFDPITFIGAGVLLGTTALLAAYVPARRASRVDPITALRGE